MLRFTKKTFRRMGLALAALSAALGIGAFFLFLDEPPPDDTDLILVRRSVPDEENGFLDIHFEKEAMYWPSEDDLRGAGEEEGETDPDSDPEERFAAEIVERNAEALSRLESALGKKDFQMPAVKEVFARTKNAGVFMRLSQALLWRSRLHARAGRHRDALADALGLARFGMKVSSAQGLLIQSMQGYAMQIWAHEEVRDLAASTALTLDDLRSCLRQLEPLPGDELALTDTMREEYRVWLATLNAAGGAKKMGLAADLEGWRKHLLPWTRYKPNLTRRRLAEGIRKLIQRASRSPTHAKAAEGDAFHLPEGLLNFIANGSGDLFVKFILTANERILDDAPYRVLSLDATRVVVAIHAFQKSTGLLPSALDELVPEYLDAVPRDPFDGKPLRYSAVKKIVYSIGRDLIDRGGTTGGKGRDCEDALEPTFRIGE